MAANNTNYYPDGYVVIPLKDYNELLGKLNNVFAHQKVSPTYHVNDEKHGKILALHNAGWDVTAIAREMGVSRCTIYNHLKRG